MATNEQLEKAREEALKSPDIGKRGKGRKTLMAEELRSIFIEKVSEFWEQLLEAQIEDAFKDRRAREFLINQTIGKIKSDEEQSSDSKDISEIITEEQLVEIAKHTLRQHGITYHDPRPKETNLR